MKMIISIISAIRIFVKFLINIIFIIIIIFIRIFIKIIEIFTIEMIFKKIIFVTASCAFEFFFRIIVAINFFFVIDIISISKICDLSFCLNLIKKN